MLRTPVKTVLRPCWPKMLFMHSTRLLKALSVRQPWAHAIIYGGKDVENRSWTTAVRGTIAIHASQTLDKRTIEDYFRLVHDRHLTSLHSLGRSDVESLPRGAILGL